MEKQLNELVDRLKKTFGDRLVSVILYGSGAGGDKDRFSDLNVFCVLSKITPAELADSEPIFRWWQQRKHPAPLLMSEQEVASSTDCFPIEYRDMKERRKVLFGKDAIEGLVIDESFYRAQVEVQLRSKLLRLRQKAAGVFHDKELLGSLMADSVSTFLILARHMLLLSGEEVSHDRHQIAARLAPHTAIFQALLDIREGRRKPGSADTALFAEYLSAVQALVDTVDKLQK